MELASGLGRRRCRASWPWRRRFRACRRCRRGGGGYPRGAGSHPSMREHCVAAALLLQLADGQRTLDPSRLPPPVGADRQDIAPSPSFPASALSRADSEGRRGQRPPLRPTRCRCRPLSRLTTVLAARARHDTLVTIRSSRYARHDTLVMIRSSRYARHDTLVTICSSRYARQYIHFFL